MSNIVPFPAVDWRGVTLEHITQQIIDGLGPFAGFNLGRLARVPRLNLIDRRRLLVIADEIATRQGLLVLPRRRRDCRSVMMRAALLVIGCLMTSPAHATANAIIGNPEVVDGDGLVIGPIRIRLHGIDAPELGQSCADPAGGTWPCDKAAAERLEVLIGGGEVTCEPLDRDAYGRIIARCTAGDVDLAETLTAEGLVWAFRRYSDDYAPVEDQARSTGRGIWQAATEPPWDYRADRWERAVQDSPAGCPIKGNISSKGEQIYHTPWSSWYSRTKIDVANGERWFCDEPAALAAGWRAARFR